MQAINYYYVDVDSDDPSLSELSLIVNNVHSLSELRI